MKFLILSENSNGTWPYLHYRGLGCYELARRISLAGYESTVIDWFTHWTFEQLQQAMTCWFADTDKPVIAISTPFSPKDIFQITELLEWAKITWPDVKIIHGGGRVYDPSIKNIDVFFLGRSMQIFDDWLNNKDLSQYTVNETPLVLKNLNFNQYIDVPVVPNISSDDFFTKDDILGFEIGVGCKFNCTFCNYELRGAKISNLLDRETLFNFLNTAYKEHGIQNFFVADDTPNESDTKLEILADVVERLDFKPNITGFSRLDIFAARPSQQELYKRIQFESLFFGIESFNDTASRMIRKKSGFFNVYDALKTLRTISPNTFLVGGLIVGLNGDSEESIRESIANVIQEKLLDSIQLYSLSITKAKSIFDDGFHSDLDNSPEKFGYKISEGSNIYRSYDLIDDLHWTSDWTNKNDATLLADKISFELSDKISDLNHMEYAGLKSLGLIDRQYLVSSIDIVRKRAYNKSNKLKKNYIDNKLSFLKGLKNEKNFTSSGTGTV